MRIFKISKGFTLIELLIVIALLGALAVGLLAALDPFEQLKKGTDTGTRNTVAEIQGATIRYYSIKQYMPWCTDASTCTDPNNVKASTLTNAGGTGPIDLIVTAGELKTDFVTLAGGQLGNIYVKGTNDPPEISVCYKPTSKSFLNDNNTKYSSAGVTPHDGGAGNCPTGKAADDCWYCVK